MCQPQCPTTPPTHSPLPHIRPHVKTSSAPTSSNSTTVAHTDHLLRLRGMMLCARCMRSRSWGGRSHAAGASRARAGRAVSSRTTKLRVQALGFDFGDGERDSRGAAAAPPKPSPKAFAAYALRASSLLVFQHVFKGAVGEALLGLIAASQKYQASNRDIISAYAKFYNLLMLSGYDDWSDYVLDQLLLGRDNPFARAAAQGQVQQGAPILQAVAYDLDTLQALCVSLTTLAEYVGEVAPTAGSYWVSAASATSVKRGSSAKQLPTAGAPAQPAVVIPADGSSSSSGSVADFIGPPATPDELAQWRGAIAGHDPWSAAAPLLQQYYQRHGFGVTSRNATLRWSKGGFEEASEGGLAPQRDLGTLSPATTTCPPAAAVTGQQAVLTPLQGAFAALAENTRRHCAGLPAHHALVCGPPGAGKSWLLWEGTLLAGRAEGLRLVEVPGSELANLLDVARGCGRYPRLRFVLVADHVELPLRGGGAADLLGALAGCGGSGWPSNTLLYLGASAASTVSRTDPLVARCPLVVPVEGLQGEEAFSQVMQELLQQQQGGGGAVAEELSAAAAAWGAQQGWSVRSAATFVRSVCR